jgi:predicted RNase H-like HicB family nuclease
VEIIHLAQAKQDFTERITRMQITYEAILTPEEDGQYSVKFPDFEGGTCGDGFDNAIEMAADFLWLNVSWKLDKGQPLPTAKFGRKVSNGQRAVPVSLKFNDGAVNEEWAWIPAATAAELLGITTGRVRVMASKGVLPCRRMRGSIYVAREAVEARKASPPQRGRPTKRERELTVA